MTALIPATFMKAKPMASVSILEVNNSPIYLLHQAKQLQLTQHGKIGHDSMNVNTKRTANGT